MVAFKDIVVHKKKKKKKKRKEKDIVYKTRVYNTYLYVLSVTTLI